MEALIFWLCGWIILSIGYYIYEVYEDYRHLTSKKLYAWRAFWTGILSWIGIIFIIIFVIVASIFAINEWVEKKLS